MLSGNWIRINGLLLQRRDLQRVIRMRKLIGWEKWRYMHMITYSIGQKEWNVILSRFGSFSDAALEWEFEQIEKELDFHLEKEFLEK